MLGIPLPTLITRALTLVIAFAVHEFAHAWTADWLGDETPRAQGRLTLNPLAHLDLMGSLLLLVTGFGWAKPVQVNPYALQRRTPAGMMLVAAAGPISNLLLALAASIPLQVGMVEPGAAAGRLLPSASSFLLGFILINLILFFFNLVPLSPLDGEKVLAYFLPPSAQQTLYQIRPYGPLILLLLLFVTPRLGLDVFGLLVGWPALYLRALLVS